MSNRSYIFTLDSDSLLITFASETGKQILFEKKKNPIDLVYRINEKKILISVSRLSKFPFSNFKAQKWKRSISI